MRNIVRIIVVLTLGFLGGCNIANAPLTGTWLFNLATSGSDVILATANLTQHGSDVMGQVTLSGSGVSCGITNAMMATGIIQGSNLALQFTQAQNIITFIGKANVTFTFLTGTYVETAGSCLPNGGIGSWSASLQ